MTLKSFNQNLPFTISIRSIEAMSVVPKIPNIRVELNLK